VTPEQSQVYAGNSPDATSEERTATTDDNLAEPEADADDELTATRPDEARQRDEDVIVAEIIDGRPGATHTLDGTPQATQAPDHPVEAIHTVEDGTAVPAADNTEELSSDAASVGGTTAGGAYLRAGAAQEWREIQATFVDDPRGAVRMAADATDAAVRALVDSLRDRESSLLSNDGPGGMQDTEQLRAALRQYRTLCQSISEMGRHISLAG